MITPNELSTLNFSNGLIANALNQDDKMSLVYNLTNGYNTLTYLVDRLNGGKSKQVVGAEGKIQKPLVGRMAVVTSIASNATSGGSNLRVNFNDPNYSLFRVNEIVFDSNRNQGRVVTSAPGYVILSPTPKNPAFSTSTMFTSTMWIKSGWNASQNRGSSTPTAIYKNPYYDYNYTSITRATAQYFAMDKNQTWVRYKGGFWYTSVDAAAMEDLGKQLEFKAWMSERGQTIDPSGQTVNHNGGLLWAIKDPVRGGVIQPMANNPTKADYERFMGSIAKRQASATNTQTWLCGRDALTNIQTTYTQNFIQYAGSNNTFGGQSVKGLDVQTLQIAGTTVNLINCKFFDDPDFFFESSTISGVNGTKMGNTIVALDTGMYQAEGGGQLPAIENIYFGDKEMSYGFMTGIGMGESQGQFTNSGQPYAGVTTDKDSLTMMTYTNNGVDAIATKMGIMELVS